MGLSELKYPHKRYKSVLTGLLGFYRDYPGVYAIAVIGSLARDRAVKDSCIDLCIFLDKEQFDALPSTIQLRAEAYTQLNGEISYHVGQIEGGITFGDVRVDLIFTDGSFKAYRKNSFDIVRDEFETTIGNLFVYAALLYEKDRRYQDLREHYLPFYDDGLRNDRLKGTAGEFRFKIWKTRWLARRGLFFASLSSLLEAKRIFLQHLFIKEEKYPIDYTKWLKEQLGQILGMPHVYERLVACVSGLELEEDSLCMRSRMLEELFCEYAASV